MLYKYEIACKNAGLNQEQINEIRKVFDVDRRRLKRENVKMEQENIRYGSMDDIDDSFDGMEKRDIEDPRLNIELDYIKKWEMEQLQRFLTELTEEEREFLLVCFEESVMSDSRIADRLGLPRATVYNRRKRLLKKLRNRFEEEKIEVF